MNHGDPACRVGLLGGFCLRIGDEIVDLPVGAQRVVAFVSLHDRPVSRSRVAGHLWPEATERQARACLRSAVWRMRRARLPLVRTTQQHIGLVDHLDVDVTHVRARARRLMDLQEGCVPDDLDPAVFTGELLPDWPTDEWVLIEREHLRQVCLHALEAMSHRLLLLGRYGEAAVAALTAVRAEPLRESAHRALMRVHIDEGNVGEAVRQYRWYARLLQGELGIEPSPKIRELLHGARSGMRRIAR